MLKKTLLAALVLSAASTAAQANEVTGYLTGSIGQSNAKDASNKDLGYKVAVGLQANPYFALEGQYIDLGKAKDKASGVISGVPVTIKASGETKGLGANLVGTLPLDDFKLFAKVGYHRLETKVNAKVTAPGVVVKGSGKDHEWVSSFGVGAGYSFTPELAVVAEYERYKDVADAYNVDLASIGLRYSF